MSSPTYGRSGRVVGLIAAFTNLLVFACPHEARALSNDARQDFYSTDGPVFTSVLLGNTLYIGGSFTAVGLPAGGGVPVDATSGAIPASFPKVGGGVTVALPDGSGGLYIGGSFTSVGGQSRSNLAHILADGSVASWHPIPNAQVSALVIVGNALYVGGAFSTFDGQPQRALAAVDRTSEKLLPSPSTDGVVNALTVVGSTLYVGGSFSTIAGVARNSLASFDTQTGLVTSWNPSPSMYAHISAIVLSGATAYVGGDFNMMGGQPRTGIAAVDATTGAVLPWNPTPSPSNAQANSMAMLNGKLYVGGYFTTMGGQARQNLAALDVSTASATAWNPTADGTVQTLIGSGNVVYVGGFFSSVSGQPRPGVAKLNAASAQVMSWSPAFGIITSISSVVLNGNTVYVGGYLGCLNPTPRSRLAAIDVRTGNATDWNPGVDQGSVRAVVVDGNTIYVGGYFLTCGGAPRPYLAAVDATTGLVTPWSHTLDNGITAMARNSTKLYVGGSFTTVDGSSHPRLVSFDLPSGSLRVFPSTGLGIAPAAMAASEDRLFIALNTCFPVHGMCLPTPILTARDANTGADVGWSPSVQYTNSLNNSLNVMTLQGNTVLVGGNSVTYGGHDNLIPIDPISAAPTSWSPGFPAADAVTALASRGNTVYIAGTFPTIGGQPRNGLAALDATTAAVLPWNPVGSGTGGTTFALTDTSVLLGGSTSPFGLTVQTNLLAFGPSVPIAWSNLDGPPSTTVTVFTSSPPVYGRAEITAVTNRPGATPGLVAQLGFGPDRTDPAADPAWQWFDGLYSAEAGSGDRFVGSFTPTASGQYDYAFRYSYDNGGWVYADLDGSSNGYSPTQAGALTVTPTLDAPNAVRELAFALAGPNPVKENARFGIDLPAASHVRLAVFDVGGRRVATLVDGVLPAGHHDVPWAASARSGIAQGVYHARLSVDDRVIDRRFVLLH